MSFPKFSVSGGPHASGLQPQLDGKLIPGLQRFVLTADVNDVVRLVTYQVVEVAVDVQAETQAGAKVYVEVFRRELREIEDVDGKHDYGAVRVPIIDAEGPTLVEALRAALEKLEAEP